MTADIRVYCHPDLKDLAGRAADAAELPLSEFVAKVLAEKLGREDLGIIPRKPPGGPRGPRKNGARRRTKVRA